MFTIWLYPDIHDFPVFHTEKIRELEDLISPTTNAFLEAFQIVISFELSFRTYSYSFVELFLFLF